MTTVPTAEVLAVSGLRFRYAKGSEELFDDLTHVFAPGRITAGTGPSGRGKSTLLYVLGLLLTRPPVRSGSMGRMWPPATITPDPSCGRPGSGSVSRTQSLIRRGRLSTPWSSRACMPVGQLAKCARGLTSCWSSSA